MFQLVHRAQHDARVHGEAGSIHAWSSIWRHAHGVDQERIFVTGLSAGGADGGAMLAAYPESFAAGAVIAGLPYRAASSVGGALEAMAMAIAHAASRPAASVRAA